MTSNTEHSCIGYIVYDVESQTYLKDPIDLFWTENLSETFIFENEKDATTVSDYVNFRDGETDTLMLKVRKDEVKKVTITIIREDCL